MVMEQLQYSGMLETIHIRRAGFPIRIRFKQFLDRLDQFLDRLDQFLDRLDQFQGLSLTKKSESEIT